MTLSTNDPGDGVETMVRLISACVSPRMEIAAAYLFGSAALGRLTSESDIDVAVYVGDQDEVGRRTHLPIEEAEGRYPWEEGLWAALESVLGRNVDLVILNRAPANLVTGILSTGIPCIIRDAAIIDRFSRAATGLAEDFRGFIYDFTNIRERSRSLSEVDRARMVRILDFINVELEAWNLFKGMTKAAYLEDGNLRRNVERWAENLVNASIDIAKIVLASQRMPMPQTYRQALTSLGTLNVFSHISDELASFTAVRNFLAHEYLDLRYSELRRLADRAPDLYGGLVRATRRWLDLA